MAAILSAHQSVLAIAKWGTRQERELLGWLGSPQGRTPCQSPVQRWSARWAGTPWPRPSLIAGVDWRGRVLTGDALFCQRQLCEQVLAAGGDDLPLVKANQATLHRDLARLFDPPPDGPPPLPLLD